MLSTDRHDPSSCLSRYSALADALGSVEFARSARIERMRDPSFSSSSAT